MRYFYFLISLQLLFCATSYTQTICIFPTLKSESIKLDEFNKLEKLQSNCNPLQVIRYTAYLVSDKENNSTYDSTNQEVIKVTVNSNSLKDPSFLKELIKFSPPFKIIIENIIVLDSKKNERTVMPCTYRIL